MNNVDRSSYNEVTLNVQPNTDYFVSITDSVEVLSEGATEVLQTGYGVFNTTEHDKVIVRVKEVNEPMIHIGHHERPFEPTLSAEEREHATIRMDLPIESVTATGLSLSQFASFINLVKSVGVRVEILSQGTFMFATGIEEEFDPNAGFYDEETGTGGYFGAMLDSSNPLPI
jgi:hypothetical protein